jgi:hypothetical protein
VPFQTAMFQPKQYPRGEVELRMLHEFIAENREEIIRRCRAKVATRSIPPPTEVEIDHGVPVFWIN